MGSISSEPLRVALAGAGRMAANHARAVARLGRLARLVAVAEPSPAARSAMAAIAPGAAAFDSLDALLAAGPVDVVHVCTPPETHFELARRALAAGCHAYVEKPFTQTAREAEELVRIAADRGLRVCAGHQLLFEAPARRAGALLPALGRLVQVESYFSFRTVRRAPGGRAPLRADLQLLDILPHPVYLLLQFLTLGGSGPVELAALELGEAGTVHALVRRGGLVGHLTVTLEGRPVESYLRLVGTNGTIHADFVRGTVQRLFGPGSSGIDKLLEPYRIAAQLLAGTTLALGGRFLHRRRSYPGLLELLEAFYGAIRSGGPPPLEPEGIIETVRLCERVAEALAAGQREPSAPATSDPAPGKLRVLVTGGTGFLGRAVVRRLAAGGHAVVSVSRRAPAAWERVPGVRYEAADLGAGASPGLFRGVDVVIHAAAETAGGWEEHGRNSIAATEHVLRAAAAAGVRRVIHVSSLAVLSAPANGVLSEDTPLPADARGLGPYTWGKVESERLARRLGAELGVGVKVVRPGAIVDYGAFEPPGRLGKRVGPLFVAVGSPEDRLGVVDLEFSAEVLTWLAEHFDEAPAALNLLAPELPSKRDLVNRLRSRDPDLKLVWLPAPALVPLSWAATAAQKLLRPGKPAISLRAVFAARRYDTGCVSRLAQRIRSPGLPASATW